MDLKSRIDHLPKEKRQLLALRMRNLLGKTKIPDELEEQSLESRDSRSQTSPSSPNAKRQLNAYLVPSSGKEVTVGALRDYLQERLPYYMIPNNFFILDAIPLTPNGKVDRQALAHRAYQPNKDAEETYVAPRNDIEETLAKIWSTVLNVEKVGVHDNFFGLGGDSILSIQIISKARQEGLTLTARQLFQNQTIARLALGVGSIITTKSEQGLVLGAVPLTPIQHWFFEQNWPEPHHWNQSVILQVKPDVTYEAIQQVMAFLIKHHDALRLAFTKKEGNWQQSSSEVPSRIPNKYFDLSGYDSAQQRALITEKATEEQKNLNLFEGRVFKAIYFECESTGRNRLLLIAHHLVIDNVSWRILLEDLETACDHLILGKPVTLPAKTTSFKFWSEKLTSYAQTQEVNKELAYWSADAFKEIDKLPVDHPASNETNTVCSVCKLSSSLSKDLTEALLHKISDVYHTQINDILLTALLQTFAHWTGRKSLLLGLEGHGREDVFEDVDLSRTVGWFTAYFPVYLTLKNPADLGKSIIEIKEQVRKIPNRGLGFGLLRYCCQAQDVQREIKTLADPQVCFNYLGRMDKDWVDLSRFEKSDESVGQERSTIGSRPYLLEFNGYIKNGQFYLDCSYSQNIHKKSTIGRLISHYIEILGDLINHCQSPNVGGYSPSDFPEAGLNQDDLDQFISKITN